MTRSRLLVVMIAAALAFAMPTGASTTYEMDPGHSQADFTVHHFGVSKVRGALPDVSGTIEFDATDPTNSTISVRIKTCTLNSNNEARDEALRSSIFFHVEKHPAITFVSTGIKQNGSLFVVHGDLTIREITREVSIDMELMGPTTDPFGSNRLGAYGELLLDRRDFGMTLDKTLPGGDLLVGNDVLVELHIEAVESVPEDKATP